MRLLLYIVLILCHTLSVKCQLSDSLCIFFEDGIGNKDSIFYGGIIGDTMQPYKGYDETPFQEFNPVFQVAISNFAHYLHPTIEEATFSKHEISEYDPILQSFGESSGISIRIINPPLKMYYNRSFFDRGNTRGGFISPDRAIGLIPPAGHGNINRYECLADQDTLIFYLGSQYIELDFESDWRLAKLTDGTVDTIWGLQHDGLFVAEGDFGGICPLRTNTQNEPDVEQDIHIKQVGNQLVITNNSQLRIIQGHIVNVSGRISNIIKDDILPSNTKLHSLEQQKIGTYILVLNLENGSTIRHKLILVP